MKKEIRKVLDNYNVNEYEAEKITNELLNLHLVSKRLLTDVTVEYNHPTGLIRGKLEYDDDSEYLVLNYEGGTIHRPYLEKCNVC